ISEIRSLSADCLPSLLDASVSGVSASQFFGRSVAYFFHPLRITEKNMKDNLVLNRVWNKTSHQFFLLKHKVDWNGRYGTPAGKAYPSRDPTGAKSSAGGLPSEY
ncbi:hypothetical protein M4D76_24065, partial [Peribacillus frigoritolerans]|uniref:hypothetical protein n=1 Tax=Peribacillus frigoritolerans TaxID=450367 RepID=UPI0021A3996B